MAGAPPPHFGGDRQFMADPQATGLSTMVGDMAAINLQLMHMMRHRFDDDAERAAIDALAVGTRDILAASNTSHAREASTRELRPITRVPDDEWGNAVNIAVIRLHNVPVFSGTDKDTVDIVRWISKIFSLAQTHTLTFAATIHLMYQASTGHAADYLEQMRDEHKTLPQVVQLLEMRYGDLCTPEEARVRTNNMARKEKESLSVFIDRLRVMARMACRMENDNAIRRQGIDLLVENNIRRVLPMSVRGALEERVRGRTQMGLPALTAHEIEKECLDLERRREERKSQTHHGGMITKRHARISKIDDIDVKSESEDELTSSEDDLDVQDESTYNLIKVIKQETKKYTDRARTYDPKKVFKRAVRQFNQNRPPLKYPRATNVPPGARLVGAAPQGNPNYRQPGPPNRLDQNVKRSIPDLLELANCTRGSCIQCGVEGHYMHQDVCALRDKTLVDRPCIKCGRGLHAADDCMVVFQKNYVAPQHVQGNPNQANLVQSENTLNEN
jgi:hypothetical protein